MPTVLIGLGWATVGDTSPDANLGDRIGTANLRNDGYNVLTWDPRGFVTPIPVVLDGQTHTISRPLEVVALRGHPTSNLRLQLVPSAPLYGPQRSLGSVTVSSLTTSLPLVDAAATPP